MGSQLAYFYYYQDTPDFRGPSWCGAAQADLDWANATDVNRWRIPYLMDSCIPGVSWSYSHSFQDGSRYHSPLYRGINMVCSVQPDPPPPPPVPLGCLTGAGGFTACLPDTGVPLSDPAPPPPGTPQGAGPGPNDGPPSDPASADPVETPKEPEFTGAEACRKVEEAGNPISVATGNKYQQEVDYLGPRGMNIVRRYNSSLPGWVHNFGARVFSNATAARVFRPDGRAHMFTGSAPGLWAGEPAALEQLFKLSPADPSQPAWKYVTASDTTELYDATGRLVSVTPRGGTAYTLDQRDGVLHSVRDPFGNALLFAYDSQNRLVGVTTPEGTSIGYGYDSQGRLSQVSYPDGTTRKYLYENSAYPLALTGLVDERGVRFATWTYDAAGRAVSSEHAGGVKRFQLAFNPDGSTSVTDPLGTSRTQVYAAAGARKVFAGQSQRCAGCIGDAASKVVDLSTGLLQQSVDYLGITTLFTNDRQRKLPVGITEAAGRPEQRQRSIEWAPNFRLPVLISESGRTTASTHDALGNKLSETITDIATGQVRTWQWTYTTQGLVQTMMDPKGGVWRYGYDVAGNRVSMTNPLGQQIAFGYDLAGRVTSVTEPNGLRTTYTYDRRGRLAQQVRGADTTAYAYTPTGLMASVTMPNGHQLMYTYDDAQRLIGVVDNRGASIQYTLDAAGNRVRDEVKDASGALALVTSRIVDGLNNVVAMQGSVGQTTALTYDANGAPVAQTDPLNQTTRQTLDGLGRAVATTFADNAIASRAWSQLDQLTRAVDPKGVATAYQTNAFGEVVGESSPDVGSMSFQRDAAGDVVAMTDAKRDTSTIARDPLGRPLQISDADNAQTFLSYDTLGNILQIEDRSGRTSYLRDLQGRIMTKTQTVNDNPANPAKYAVQYGYSAGELASVRYPSGLTVFLRRTAGRITGIDVQPVASASGKPVAIAPLVSALTYTALGTPKSWSFMNGDKASRSFDADGRMIKSEIAAYTYDAASRITSITQNLWTQRLPASKSQAGGPLSQTQVTWNAGYDSRNRLTAFTRTGVGSTYSYDPNSNRLSAVETIGSDIDLDSRFDADNLTLSVTQAQNVDVGSNRLLGFNQTLTLLKGGVALGSLTGRVNYGLDANGAMTSDGLRSFVYDASRRLAKVELLKDGEGASISYLHNGLGQRVFKGEPRSEKTKPNEATLGRGFIAWLQMNFGWLFDTDKDHAKIGMAFVYDEQGNLLGEYDNGSAAGKGRTEYIWLPTEDGPSMLAGIYRNGQFFAVHTDHLGTPRLVTDSDNKPVWQWPYSAFGNNKPIGVLAATVTKDSQTRLKPSAPDLELNLRFPGQYFDAESNLSYNYFRSYQAGTGRYTQPDPIRLDAGWNRFAYVGGNPFEFADPMGLQRAPFSTPFGRPAYIPNTRETLRNPDTPTRLPTPLLRPSNVEIFNNLADPAGNLVNSITGQNRYPSIDTSADGTMMGPQGPDSGSCQLIFAPSSTSCPAVPTYRLWCGPVIGPR